MSTVAWLGVVWLLFIMFVWSWLVAAARADRRAARRPPPAAAAAPQRFVRRARDRVHH